MALSRVALALSFTLYFFSSSLWAEGPPLPIETTNPAKAKPDASAGTPAPEKINEELNETSESPPELGEPPEMASPSADDGNTELVEVVSPEAPETEAAPEKTSESTSESTSQDSLYGEGKGYETSRESIAKYHLYEQHLPQIGVSLSGAFRALGSDQPIGSGAGQASAGSLEIEYQPEFLQSIGVIGFGPTVAVYPVGKNASGQTNTSGIGLHSFGGQIRYQAQWVPSQLIVPMIAFQYEQLFYSLKDNAKGNFAMSGPAAGLWILLNTFEPSAAGDLWVDTGISRSYLTAEWRDRAGGDNLIDVSGSAIFVGLRVEF